MEIRHLPKQGYCILVAPTAGTDREEASFTFVIGGERYNLRLDKEKVYKHNGDDYFAKDAFNSLFFYSALSDDGVIYPKAFQPVKMGMITSVDADGIAIDGQRYPVSPDLEVYDFYTFAQSALKKGMHVLYRLVEEEGTEKLRFIRCSTEPINILNLGHSTWSVAESSVCEAEIFENHFTIKKLKETGEDRAVLPAFCQNNTVCSLFADELRFARLAALTIKLVPPPRGKVVTNVYGTEPWLSVVQTGNIEGAVYLVVLIDLDRYGRRAQLFARWDNGQEETFTIFCAEE